MDFDSAAILSSAFSCTIITPNTMKGICVSSSSVSPSTASCYLEQTSFSRKDTFSVGIVNP